MAMHGSCSRAKAPLRLTNSDNANDVRHIRRKNFQKDSVCSFDLIAPPQQPQIKSTGYLANRYNHPYFDEREERKQKVTINVSGERYQTFVDTLDRFPKTLLGNAIKRERFYDDVEDEYFFDRDRSAFNAILYYYQSNGRLYCPLTVPMTILVTEAKFFQLGNDALKQVLDLDNENKNDILPKNKWQRKIWCIFEHPETSRTAHCITLFSVIMILLSVCILCLETLQVFKGGKENLYSKLQNVSDSMNKVVYGQNSSLFITVNINNKTFSKATAQLCNCFCEFRTAVSKQNEESQINNTTQATNDKIDWTYIFHTCEAVFVAWFTFEYLIRLLTAPEKCVFLKNYLNIIDIVSILPFYITAALNRTNGFGLENFRVIRLVRVFRIFKLSRHSKGLQILGFTLQASMRELGLMIFFLAMGVILFSSAVYYLEEGNFTSIPDAFWWAIITMCTVGYGDKVPKSFFGKIIGGACAVCGVLSIALPVPVIVSNFDYFYNRERTKKLHESYIDRDGTEEGVERQEKSPPSISSPCNDIAHDHYFKESPVLSRNHNGSVRSVRSPIETRNDEIQRQATIRGLEKRSRKLSQRLSQSSGGPSPFRKVTLETPPVFPL